MVQRQADPACWLSFAHLAVDGYKIFALYLRAGNLLSSSAVASNMPHLCPLRLQGVPSSALVPSTVFSPPESCPLTLTLKVCGVDVPGFKDTFEQAFLLGNHKMFN